MPAGLPGSSVAQNNANPSAGNFVIFDPLSGPKGSPLSDGVTGRPRSIHNSTGAMCNGIGFSAQNIIFTPNPLLGAPAMIDNAGFIDDQVPGTISPNEGVQNTVDSVMMYIGGGRCDAPVQGIAAPDPYTAGIAICGAGNGGSRDGGAGPAFTGFALKMVTAAGAVVNGAAIEVGFINRSGITMAAGESAHGSDVATLGAAS
jgi:hypothetical protein